MDQVDFGADCPLGTCGRFCKRFDDAFGRADLIRGLRYFETAFWVDDHANARMLAAHLLDMLRRKALVDRAVALPKNHASSTNCVSRVAAKFLVRIPDDHLH